MKHRRAWTALLYRAYYHGFIPRTVMRTGLKLVRLMWPPKNHTPTKEQP